MDLSASTQPRNDLNGNPCALVKVQLATADASFEGNVIGDVAYIENEYWVYMSAGSYMLQLKHKSFVPLFINFRDYGITRVEQKATYVISLQIPNRGSSAVDDGTRFLAMTVVPAEASVLIDNQPQKLNNGSISLLLPAGKHSYRVEAPGYASQSGTFNVAREKVSLSIKLESIKARLSVSCATSGCEIFVNEQFKDSDSWTGMLLPGSYTLEVRKNHYRPVNQTITLSEKEDKIVELPELEPIVGNVSVNYLPKNAEVWLDGKSVGSSPDIFRNIITGSHQIELRMEGYWPYLSTVTIEENKTTQVSGELIKKSQEDMKRETASEMTEIGNDFFEGRNGKQQDYVEAVKWYRKAAEQGDAYAQCCLGNCYNKGNGVTQDYTEAVKWYRKAAEQGDAKAQFLLGCMCADGVGITQNYNEAVKWLRKAADQDFFPAYYSIGMSYYYGQGVKQDHVEAVKWYRKAAEHGDSDAETELGDCYYYGRGITQDYTEAFSWYKKAAEQGDASAQYKLGNCYGKGKGVIQDAENTVKWYRKAANQGHVRALLMLGACYLDGFGVEVNKEEAAKLWQQAADSGDEEAKKFLNTLIGE